MPESSQNTPQLVPLMSADLESVSQYDSVWFRMAMKITDKDILESKELVQEMYLKLYDIFQKKEMESISSLYVYKVILRLFLNRRTKKQWEYSNEDMTIFEQLDDDFTLEERKMISKALDKIPYLEREVLLQHQEKSQRQLQRETGVCRDRLRLHKNNAMDKLTIILEQEINERKLA